MRKNDTREVDLRRLDIFTTGDAARACRAAPRTVAKWFDAGRLNGYRLPTNGTRDERRIPRGSLLHFMRLHGLPTDLLDSGNVLLVSLEPRMASQIVDALPADCKCHTAATAFAAGLLVRDLAPAVVVIDLAGGRAEGISMATAIREHAECADAVLIAVACEDETGTPGLIQAGFAEVFQRPFDVQLLAEHVRMVEV